GQGEGSSSIAEIVRLRNRTLTPTLSRSTGRGRKRNMPLPLKQVTDSLTTIPSLSSDVFQEWYAQRSAIRSTDRSPPRHAAVRGGKSSAHADRRRVAAHGLSAEPSARRLGAAARAVP